MGHNKTRKNAPHYPPKNASTHHSDKKNKQKIGGKDIRDDEISEDTQEEDSTNGEYDQDSSISFEDDEGSTAGQEDELEDWIEYYKEARKKLMKKC